MEHFLRPRSPCIQFRMDMHAILGLAGAPVARAVSLTAFTPRHAPASPAPCARSPQLHRPPSARKLIVSGARGSTLDTEPFPPLDGRYSYKQLRLLPVRTPAGLRGTSWPKQRHALLAVQPLKISDHPLCAQVDQLRGELAQRNLPTIGYRIQLAGRECCRSGLQDINSLLKPPWMHAGMYKLWFRLQSPH